MNLYLKVLTRELLPTDKFEQFVRSRLDVIARYHKVQQSPEFKEYQELGETVAADAFQSNRNKLLNTSYSDTHEGKTMSKFRRLGLSPDVLVYQSMLDNKNIAAYLEFIKDPENVAKLQDKEAVKNDEKLKLMHRIHTSLAIKDFFRREKGKSVQEYLKLKAEIRTEEFQEQNTFWQNPHRWYATPDSKTYERYEALQRNPDIVFYNQQKPEEMARIDRYELAFEDNFSWTDLAHSQWKPGFVYPSKDFVSVHSWINELQAYNNGKNIRTEEGKLYIDTKKEKVTAPAWDDKKGMVQQKFNYTSDVINYGEPLSTDEGIVVVKARCRGILNHGIYLRSANHLPFISVFNYHKLRLYCGVKSSANEGLKEEKLNGIQPITYLIYTVAWDKDDIVWYINNVEVHREKNNLPKDEKLYLHMYSYGFKGENITEGNLQVDWVYIYKPKR